MNGELRQISVATMEVLMKQHLNLPQNELEIMIQAGQVSRPLYLGMFSGKLICLVGLVPPTILSDVAYIWCYHTEELLKCKIMFARHTIRLMPKLRQSYPRIIGHCFNDESRRWLATLGAIQTSDTTFEIA